MSGARRGILSIMSPAPASDRFYADLPSFHDFNDFADFSAYRSTPDDWVVLAGDIVGSRAAIAAGRYKAVNMLGAAVITAAPSMFTAL